MRENVCIAAERHTHQIQEPPPPPPLCSSDSDEDAFKGYLSEMSWKLAVPFENDAVKDALSKRFSVTGIPRLVVLDKSGAIVNSNARGNVTSDAAGAGFPWRS